MRAIAIIIVTTCVSLFWWSCQKAAPVIEEVPAILEPYFNHDWAKQDFWDDGLAEVAKYEAQRKIYGQPRYFEYTHILVKEDFNKEYRVKTNNYEREDLYEVLKVHKIGQIPTPNYPFHYSSSLFVYRDDPLRLHRFTNSASEWCGNTFKSFIETENGFEYTYHSYFDGEGDGQMTIEGELLFEDQLSMVLRTLNFEEGLSFDYPVLLSEVNNKAKAPVIKSAHFSVDANKDAGFARQFRNLQPGQIWHIKVDFGEERTNEYWIGGAYPNLLIRQINSNGEIMTLRNAIRSAYWER